MFTRQITEEQAKETATSIDVEVANSSAIEQRTKTVSVDKQADSRDLLRLAMQAFDIQVGLVSLFYSKFQFLLCVFQWVSAMPDLFIISST